jgi:transposase
MLIVLGTMYVLMQLMQVHYYDPVQDAGMTESQAAFWKEYDATQQLWTSRYKWYIPFYLPWMSLIYWAWLRMMKMRYTFAESIVITFFSSSQMTIPQLFVLVLAWVFNNTAFTRTSDQVLNWGIIILIYFFQFYQLGNPSLNKSWKIILSATGAAMMMAFALTAIFAFLWLANKIGL